MDKDTRSLIQRATQDARQLLETEYREQLEGLYDVLPNSGDIAQAPGAHLDAHGRFTRTRIVAAIAHERTKVGTDKEAIAAYLREASFTTLNRFAALKLMEARRIVQESVSKGDQSAGFREFSGLAPGLGDLPDRGYRLYLECIFDEIGVEVGALFDRRHPSGLLWPRRPALLELIEILNRPNLASVWSEDETIGWIYQYFNDDAERKKMRDESAAPRNSRELAVRNQFFTPRYVVQFLTDNTLGRIWYEMRKGETTLQDECRYMVRRLNEVFLKPGETAPAETDEEKEADLTQEELLQQPVHIPHRPLKDPREIRLLDPACGSMHFGLYAFDLFERVYAEAWELMERFKADGKTAKQLESECPEFSPFVAYASSFKTKNDFLRTVPRLILEHNIHGIDIDPRATQIAGFALWLRAQRSWATQDVRPADRPGIEKTNIVCAEPMPGDRELLREFTVGLNPPFLGQIVEKVWESMQLAGEAGPLIKIEAQIEQWVQTAKQRWRQLPKADQLLLFEPPGTYSGKRRQQEELSLDLSGITNEQFWEEAEERLYDALREFAAHAESENLRQRLFANDALQGFAFIDLCRKRYDVALMNPPFGAASPDLTGYLESYYNSNRLDLFAAFCERLITLGTPECLCGAITPRDGFFKKTLVGWRDLMTSHHMGVVADFGIGVLDGATVRVAAYTFGNQRRNRPTIFFDLVDREPRDELLKSACITGNSDLNIYINRFKQLPLGRFLYWLPTQLWSIYETGQKLENDACTPRYGLTTLDDERFCRLSFEVSTDQIGVSKSWAFMSKGGDDFPYGGVSNSLVLWRDSGAEMAEVNRISNGQIAQTRRASVYYFQPCLTFSNRSVQFGVRWHPANYAFSVRGPAIVPLRARIGYLLGFFNSRIIRVLIEMQTASQTYTSGVLKDLPWPEPSEECAQAVEGAAIAAFESVRSVLCTNEMDPFFYGLVNQGDDTPRSINEFLRQRTLLIDRVNSQVAQAQKIIDDHIQLLYGFSNVDLDRCARVDESEINQSGFPPVLKEYQDPVVLLLHFAVGITIGRWLLNCNQCVPEIKAAAPVAQPALSNLDSAHAIVVDDPGHPADLATGLSKTLESIFPDGETGSQIPVIETHIGMTLQTWIQRQLFRVHLNIYSGFGRQAPVYWPLSTTPGSYTIWLYYHRFNNDTFYRVREMADEKFRHEERKLFSIQQEAGPNPSTGQAKAIAAQEQFVDELREFRAEVARVAPLWNPNLNDGVIINFAPFHRLISNAKWRQDVTACWEKLVVGDYDWSHLAMHLWPERVVPKCATDRSLAIAHGLDEVFWEPDPEKEGKYRRKSVTSPEIDRLVAERTSAAVKAALESLTSAPVTAPRTKRRRKAKS